MVGQLIVEPRAGRLVAWTLEQHVLDRLRRAAGRVAAVRVRACRVGCRRRLVRREAQAGSGCVRAVVEVAGAARQAALSHLPRVAGSEEAQRRSLVVFRGVVATDDRRVGAADLVRPGQSCELCLVRRPVCLLPLVPCGLGLCSAKVACVVAAHAWW